jgi:signal peptidase I
MRPAILILLALLLLLSGCGPSQRNTGVEKGTAPTSSVTVPVGMYAAKRIAELSQRFFVLSIAPTGSMEPLINSKSIVVLESLSNPTDIQLGQILTFSSDEHPYIMHRAIEFNGTAVLMDGVANFRGDGWVPIERINGRVVAIVYTQ